MILFLLSNKRNNYNWLLTGKYNSKCNFHYGRLYQIETSPLVLTSNRANQLVGFYMSRTCVMNKFELTHSCKWECPLDNGPKLTVEQPNSRSKNKIFLRSVIIWSSIHFKHFQKYFWSFLKIISDICVKRLIAWSNNFLQHIFQR